MTDHGPFDLPHRSLASAREWSRAAVASMEPLLELLVATAADDEVVLAYVRHSTRLLELVKEVDTGLALNRDAQFFVQLQHEIKRHITAIQDIQRTQLAAAEGSSSGPGPAFPDIPLQPQL